MRPRLDRTAFQGIAGDYADLIAEHSEADPAGVILCFLTYAGNVLGRTRYFSVNSKMHHPNLYSVIVGVSGKGRKGTTVSEVDSIFRRVCNSWHKGCRRSGLVTGEGLIEEIKDPVEEESEGEFVVRGGSSDKRRLCEEPEFAKVLIKMKHKDSILSSVVRDLWDSNDFQHMTKRNPVTVTSPHVSLVTSITQEELLHVMPRSEVHNGTANRFLFGYVERERLIPLPKPIPTIFTDPLDSMLSELLGDGSEIGQVKLLLGEMPFDSQQTEHYWCEVYEDRETREDGLGEFTRRSLAQARRLALVYSSLDGRQSVSRSDIEASLAVVDYSESTIRSIYGVGYLSPEEERLLRRVAESNQITRSEVHKVFNNHLGKEKLDSMIQKLEDRGFIEIFSSDGPGKKTLTLKITEHGKQRLEG